VDAPGRGGDVHAVAGREELHREEVIVGALHPHPLEVPHQHQPALCTNQKPPMAAKQIIHQSNHQSHAKHDSIACRGSTQAHKITFMIAFFA